MFLMVFFFILSFFGIYKNIQNMQKQGKIKQNYKHHWNTILIKKKT